jgi:hypothetical protein
MSDFQVLVFSLTGYKLVTLLIGLIFALLGYKLFRLGVYEKAGELKTTWGNKSLVLKQAAPGTFFALFGVILISTTLIKGLDIERIKGLDTEKVRTAATIPYTSDAPDSRALLDELRAGTKEEDAVVQKFLSGQNLSSKEKDTLRNYLIKQTVRVELLRGAGAYARSN